MIFKTKAIGLLAGSALALSLTTGAMAQDDTSTANATLSDNPTGDCSIAFDVGTSLDLGDYEWSGTAYTFVTGSAAAADATVTQDVSNDTETCYVSTSLAGDLDNGTDTIAAADVTLQINSGGDTNEQVATGQSGAAVSVSGSIDSGAVTSTLSTGTYSATLNLDTSNSSM